MKRVLKSVPRGTDPPRAPHLEHLDLELARLDALLRLALAEANPGNATSSGLGGFAVSRSQVNSLLSPDESTVRQDGKPDAARALQRAAANLAAFQDSTSVQVRPLDLITTHFALSPMDREVLVLALAPELAPKYGPIYAYLQGNPRQEHPTVNLILSLLHRSGETDLGTIGNFLPHAPLRASQLVRLDNGGTVDRSLPSCTVRIDDTVLAFVLAPASSHARFEPLAPANAPSSLDHAGLSAQELARLRDQVGDSLQERSTAVVRITGPGGTGKRALATNLLEGLSLRNCVIDARKLQRATCFEESLHPIARWAAMSRGAIVVVRCEVLSEAERQLLLDSLRRGPAIVLMLSRVPWRMEGRCVDLETKSPTLRDRARYWAKEGRLACEAAGIAPDRLARAFPLSPGQIEQVARDLAPTAASDLQATELYRRCREVHSEALLDHAHRIEPRYSWDDLIIESDALAKLRHLANRIQSASAVMRRLEEAGGLPGRTAQLALFYGPPGTGKSMAAEVIASAAGAELYRIDLSKILSKYVGDTERALSNLFSAANASTAILFFDEADALFAKRSSIKDAHDRYANAETAHLLQELERYEGAAILATNMPRSIDAAFQRRIDFAVGFRIPSTAQRHTIWQRILPTSLRDPLDLDLRRWADELTVAGGQIRNIAIGAIFQADQEGELVSDRHVELAAKWEYERSGRAAEWGS